MKMIRGLISMLGRISPIGLLFVAASVMAQRHAMPDPVDRVTRASDNRVLVDSLAANLTDTSNWEGTGVVPDMACKADAALTLAHVTAIEKLLSGATDPDDRQRLSMALDAVKADAAAPGGGALAPPGGRPRIIVRGN
ncbi:MAG: hypothetical protein SGI90_07785 [Candidatus Eisenbacteria bacterium]|nr:hypothetical protein [Candidatus Eisenbacteria bacterium]